MAFPGNLIADQDLAVFTGSNQWYSVFIDVTFAITQCMCEQCKITCKYQLTRKP